MLTFLDIMAIALSIFGALCVLGLVYIQATELAKWKRRAIEAECEVRLLREEITLLTNRRRVGIIIEGEREIS